MQEIDIWRTAKLLIDLHGARAICEATIRVDTAAKDAHLDALRVWKRVADAVGALQKNEPTPFDALNSRIVPTNMPAKPVRLQLSRRRGFNLQALSVSTNGLPAISVARPGPRGNPFRIGMHGDRIECVEKFRTWAQDHLAMGRPSAFSGQLEMVRGKNVACFCALDQPCHGDVWLDLANRPQR